MKVSRNWLQTYFDEELPSANELADLLTFHAFEIEEVVQVGNDWVIDIDVLPNRSSDCLSHRGVARELATLLSRPLKRDPLRETLPSWPDSKTLAVRVDDALLTPRYIGAVIRGVTVGPSPRWLQERLESIGQKSINNIVDATNFVMFELGQPTHAFDLGRIMAREDGTRMVRIRSALPGEHITVLTGEDYVLQPHHQVIADGESGAPLAIAGVKGGMEAELTAETVDILLEAATFQYSAVRKTSRELKLATEASLRFQNEPARQLPAFAMRDLIALIHDVAGGELVDVTDVYDVASEHMPVDVTLEQINNLLGLTRTVEDVEKILVRFEWEFSRDEEEFAITPPWERTDLHVVAEIIEEIGRVYGYRNITSVLPPKLPSSPHVSKQQFYVEEVRRVLCELGYSEVYTYTFADRGEVELANALASDKSFMRMDLRTGILGALDLNANNAPFLGLDTVKVFEVGTIFRTDAEVLHLALGARAVTGKQSKADAQLMKDLATLAESLGVALSDEAVQDGVVELSLDAVLPLLKEPEGYGAPLPWNPQVRYAPWSAYPCMYRDIAVWVPKGVPAEEVPAVILEVAPDMLVKHYQFDAFEKDDRVSYAWHLVFQSATKTLSDAEVNPVMEKVTAALGCREGWEVR